MRKRVTRRLGRVSQAGWHCRCAYGFVLRLKMVITTHLAAFFPFWRAIMARCRVFKASENPKGF